MTTSQPSSRSPFLLMLIPAVSVACAAIVLLMTLDGPDPLSSARMFPAIVTAAALGLVVSALGVWLSASERRAGPAIVAVGASLPAVAGAVSASLNSAHLLEAVGVMAPSERPMLLLEAASTVLVEPVAAAALSGGLLVGVGVALFLAVGKTRSARVAPIAAIVAIAAVVVVSYRYALSESEELAALANGIPGEAAQTAEMGE